MPFSQEQLSKIPAVISVPRFTTYLQHCNNDRNLALELYQWNIEISSSFVTPLHVLEVTIRNAVVERLENVHTSAWPWTNGFIRSLPNPQGNTYNPQKDLQNVARRQPTMGKVVAELKFMFWQKMFTYRHDAIFWNTHIKLLFPNAPALLSVINLRKEIHDDIAVIRILRNRIAHHEPIFSRNLQDDYTKIIKLIRWRDNDTADWVESFQGVTSLLLSKP